MIHTTTHAVLRYRERVADIAPDEARSLLLSPVVIAAAAFGARYVRLAGGQRVVIVDGTVVTVLPADHGRGTLGYDTDRKRG